tara:strand:- start:97 stop:714 length:618 start_codon:yes stop_codon:yes gene_type:complete
MIEYNNLYYDSCDTTDLKVGVYYKKQGLSESDINKLTELAEDKYPFTKGKTSGQSDDLSDKEKFKTNKRDIAYFPYDENTKWIYDKLFIYSLEASEFFNIEIDIVTDLMHYVIYPEDGGHLTWHYDIGTGIINRRKLAMTVQLSDYDSYEGGEFEIYDGNTTPSTLPRHKGDIIIFPTYMLHRVTPITSGERRCLVFWTGGKPFR